MNDVPDIQDVAHEDAYSDVKDRQAVSRWDFACNHLSEDKKACLLEAVRAATSFQEFQGALRRFEVFLMIRI